MIKQSSFDEWKPQYDYVDLCEVQFTVSEFSERFGIPFELRREDGLGECYFGFVEIESKLYSLFAADDVERRPGIIFRMQGNNPSVKSSILEIKTALMLEDKCYSWFQEHYSEPKWVLYRQGDDGNEVEMDRFYREATALNNMEIFENRGHKQSYTVREII